MYFEVKKSFSARDLNKIQFGIEQIFMNNN